MEYMNNIKHITKAQLIAEIEPFADDTPIIIAINAKNYAVDTVITGNGNIYLESSAIRIGRPKLHQTPEQQREAYLAKCQRANAKRRKK